MEISILTAWAIWATRNNWMFHDVDPTVQICMAKFRREFSLLLRRAKQKYFPV